MHRNKRYTAPPSKKHPILWMFTGLLIGIFICSLFFLKKKIVVAPENSLEQTQATTPTHQAKHKLKIPDNKKTHPEATDQYDFYTMLPKMQSNQSETPAPAAPAAHPTKPLAVAEQSMLSPETKPELASTAPTAIATPTQNSTTKTSVTETPATTTAPANKKYLVVTGDFDRYEAADAQKAELVLAGITHTKIESYKQNGTTRYRINLGSYSNKANATKILGQLQAAQLTGTIIEPS